MLIKLVVVNVLVNDIDMYFYTIFCVCVETNTHLNNIYCYTMCRIIISNE